ncbi:membrane protein insertase YidC [Alteromonas ponticola]|uniref:Membrane protein insertase YidC n=1 Tax=Alteromonas ponticola TaxID=2720613 RepID=A0ABX1R573_9ALTE|nr:membrane protein insertase YidC [Alteromonas ponticola]NMH60627.1 membrane protein insertase YidC [Alteromonas ponticola]
MESQRSFLVIGLALVSFLLWQQWHVDYGPKPVEQVGTEQSIPSQNEGVASAGQTSQVNEDVPASASQSAEQLPAVETSSSRLISVTTDTLDVKIDLVGGDVVYADLLQFPVKQDSSQPYSLLRNNDQLYIAQSGLVGGNGPDGSSQGRPRYSVDQESFKLEGETLAIPLTWRNETGIVVTKTLTFTRGKHDIDVTYTIKNNSPQTANFQQYAQLKQVMADSDGNVFMPTYRGAAYSTEDERYDKYTFDDIEDKNLRETTPGGWVGMLEHYFVSAWVPPQDEVNKIYSRLIRNQYAIIGFTGEPINIATGESATLATQLYLGPKDQDELATIARGLDLTVDYGVLWWISQPLFKLLQFLHGLVGNWGLAIILITIIVKGIMYPLTKKQYESMAKLRNLAPKMQQLKERYGDDRQKMSQGMMDLYRKEKVNPMGGCFPLLLQMPIFLALYWVLMESVELRHADFYLWITDLSVKDPFYVLPILTGASMYLLQKLQPNTISDPMQQKIMQWMPVMMSVFFLWFPAGLVLYWLISNVITLIQAKIIYASMEKRGLQTK